MRVRATRSLGGFLGALRHRLSLELRLRLRELLLARLELCRQRVPLLRQCLELRGGGATEVRLEVIDRRCGLVGLLVQRHEDCRRKGRDERDAGGGWAGQRTPERGERTGEERGWMGRGRTLRQGVDDASGLQVFPERLLLLLGRLRRGKGEVPRRR